MVGFLLSKILGTQNERELKRLRPKVAEINTLEPAMQKLSDAELKARTEEFKKRVQAKLADFRVDEMEPEPRKRVEKEILDEILPEAFALVREAGRRTINMRHFDVQLMGGIVLHEGKIAEMATGEGKTLVATLAVYLNSLMGRGVHVVTVNDYLARRDAVWMGPIYQTLGLSVGVIQHDSSFEERQKAYSCDVTYGTNNEFGFDYLRDNMVIRREEQVQKELFYAIVDEVDSILIDEARTPLIISGPVAFTTTVYEDRRPLIEELVRKQRRLIQEILERGEKLLSEPNKDYEAAAKFLICQRGEPKNRRLLHILEEAKIRRMISRVELDYIRDKRLQELDEELFYAIDEKGNSVDFSEQGRQFLGSRDAGLYVLKDIAEEMKRIEEDPNLGLEDKLKEKNNLYRQEAEKQEKIHVDRQLIRAFELFENEVDYVVKDGKVIIVDEFTGRLMPGRRWSDGLHEAVEAKEKVTPERESQTLATITLQNYFRMYKKLAGMTGTAFTEAQEFHSIYKLGVIVIPTNRPLVRTNFPDMIYKTEREKFKAVAEEIADLYKKGRPVLVGTLSIEKSERLSEMLKRQNIPHRVLNAKYHEMEAHIVAQAGRLGSVTIATNMAGRGTDILLGGNPEYLAGDLIKQKENEQKQELAEEERKKIFREIKIQADQEHEQVVKLGGLHVLGTERHEARRIDNQLRGRSGRQGDPGSSRFYLSLEDDLLRLFGSDRLTLIMERFGMEEGQMIEHVLISKAIETAQRRVEEYNFSIRKQLLEYDNVMNRQREIIYEERRLVLESENLKEHIYEMVEELLEEALTRYLPAKVVEEDLDYSGVSLWIFEKFLFKFEPRDLQSKADEIKEYIYKKLVNAYEEKGKLIREQQLREFERYILLRTIDERWKEHLYNMDSLREGIGLRAYGQRDPLVEYQHEGFACFEEMIAQIKEDSIGALFKVYGIEERKIISIFEGLPQELVHQEMGQFQNITPQIPREEIQPTRLNLEETDMARASRHREETHTPIRHDGPKVGRNDPCPCGSGKKYKKCHGR
jgi:preprotein translocase subunit SecA